MKANNRVIEVEFLYFDGCPNAEPAWALLQSVLDECGVAAKVTKIAIQSPEDAERFGFLGSPTIRMNGKDIEKERRNDPPVYACRVYGGGEGAGGVPPRKMLIAAIEEAIRENG